MPISGSQAMLGAPQLNGRPGIAIDTPGKGYVYLRNVSPPTTVTEAVLDEVLLNGARANVITGTVNGIETSAFNFFDLIDVTLRTGAANDTVTMEENGLTALGLQAFRVETGAGDDTFNVLSDNLSLPGAESFTPNGDFGNAGSGDDIPAGAGYEPAEGVLSFDGGDDNDQVIATFDADWLLNGNQLVANDLDAVTLSNVENAELPGGDSGNILEVVAWDGAVTLDARGGSDQLVIHIADVADVLVVETGDGTADTLTLLGTDQDDRLTVTAGSVTSGAKTVQYDGVETLRIAGLAGDDVIQVDDSNADTVVLDGGFGSDVTAVLAGSSDAFISIHDSGPTPDANGDVDTLSVPVGVSHPLNQPFFVGGMTVLYDETIEGFNVPPIIDSDNLSVTVNEGQTAGNTGTYSDPADSLTFSASLGTVADNGNDTWSWSFDTSDGPDESQIVTITATDSDGEATSTTFALIVDNVA
ncbi:MAG: hypothetical protein ACC645_17475, partial [Pirellulales bacterium]